MKSKCALAAESSAPSDSDIVRNHLKQFLGDDYVNLILERVQEQGQLGKMVRYVQENQADHMLDYCLVWSHTKEHIVCPYFWQELNSFLANPSRALPPIPDTSRVKSFSLLEDYIAFVEPTIGLRVGCQSVNVEDFKAFLDRALSVVEKGESWEVDSLMEYSFTIDSTGALTSNQGCADPEEFLSFLRESKECMGKEEVIPPVEESPALKVVRDHFKKSLGDDYVNLIILRTQEQKTLDDLAEAIKTGETGGLVDSFLKWAWTKEHIISEEFWSRVNSFLDGYRLTLPDIPDTKNVKSFHLLKDYIVHIDPVRGLRVGCQGMEADELKGFLDDALAIMESKDRQGKTFDILDYSFRVESVDGLTAGRQGNATAEEFLSFLREAKELMLGVETTKTP